MAHVDYVLAVVAVSDIDIPFGQQFTPRTIPDAQLRDFTAHSITTAPYPFHARLLMHAPVDVVARHFGPTVAGLTDNGDGTTTLTTGANSPTRSPST